MALDSTSKLAIAIPIGTLNQNAFPPNDNRYRHVNKALILLCRCESVFAICKKILQAAGR